MTGFLFLVFFVWGPAFLIYAIDEAVQNYRWRRKIKADRASKIALTRLGRELPH